MKEEDDKMQFKRKSEGDNQTNQNRGKKEKDMIQSEKMRYKNADKIYE